MAKKLSVKSVLNRIEKNINETAKEEAAIAAEEDRLKTVIGDVFNRHVTDMTKFKEKNNGHEFSEREIDALADAIIGEAREHASEAYPEITDDVIIRCANNIVKDREIHDCMTDNVDHDDDISDVFSRVANSLDEIF